jgi:hypothetical protein
MRLSLGVVLRVARVQIRWNIREIAFASGAVGVDIGRNLGVRLGNIGLGVLSGQISVALRVFGVDAGWEIGKITAGFVFAV